MTAVDVRRDAVRQLAHLAGRYPRLDVDLVLTRPRSLLVLHRHALDARPDLRHEIDQLHAIAAGDTAALIDAVHATETTS